MKKMMYKHPFLFCAMVITVAVAIGGAFAQNIDYNNLVSNIVGLWIAIGIGYLIVYH